MSFQDKLNSVILTKFPHISLKKKQKESLESIYNGRDTLCILPTGYGKSLIYQMLPDLLAGDHPGIVLVISPLNAIIEQQVKALSKLNIPACSLSLSATVGIVEDEDSGDSDVADDSEQPLILNAGQNLEDLKAGKYTLIYGHPEAFTSRLGQEIMASSLFQERVVAIVIDEAHCIKDWFVL